jgi:hypothetical protein
MIDLLLIRCDDDGRIRIFPRYIDALIPPIEQHRLDLVDEDINGCHLSIWSDPSIVCGQGGVDARNGVD